jgi:peptide/nickel transport system ATP-binding protein
LNAAPILLEVNNLSVDYVAPNKKPAHALERVSFQLRRGEMLGVVGESGCGKSTLMLALMRLLPAAGRITQGEIKLQGSDLLDLSETQMADVRWKELSMIFQGAMNALNPVRTVGSQIAEPILRHNVAANGNQLSRLKQTAQSPSLPLNEQISNTIQQHEGIGDKAVLRRRVAELLDLVGINPQRGEQYPHQFSGGMRQRAVIAMALACLPKVVIADEPTTALDVMVQAQILELLDSLRKQLGLAVLLVTHDLGVVAEVCDSVLVMYGGVVAEYASSDTIFNQPQHPYTQALLRTVPDVSKPATRLDSIPGSPPRLDDLPAGCRFAPRCTVVQERCHQQPPPLIEVASDHVASCHLLQGREAK